MGGCGAAKIGFANPDKYCAIGILSGGPVDPTRNMESVDPEKHAYREKYVFGPVSEMAGTPNGRLKLSRGMANPIQAERRE